MVRFTSRILRITGKVVHTACNTSAAALEVFVKDGDGGIPPIYVKADRSARFIMNLLGQDNEEDFVKIRNHLVMEFWE
jgi:hypothetical protein